MQADVLKWLLKFRGERLTVGERRQLLRRGLLGAVLVALVTLAIWQSQEGHAWFERLSYDLPHLFKQKRPPEVRMVYMSETAAIALGQSFGIWNRSIHAKLIHELKKAGAKAVFFDLVLIEPGETIGLDPKIDESLHAAIREHGQVYFGAMFDPRTRTIGSMGVSLQSVVPPHDALLDAVGDHWGLLAMNPIDSDYAVRRYYGGTMYVPSTTWVLANEMGAGLGDDPDERERERWLNYYGPPESVGPVGLDRAKPNERSREFTFDSLDYDTVLLRPEEVAKEFFRDKVVFVGLRNQLGIVSAGKDEFRHPTSRWTNQYISGVEVHATAFMNLLKHEWLTRFDRRWEVALILIFGAMLSVVSARSVPWVAFSIALLAVLLMGWLGFWSQLHRSVWFNWSLPVIVQVPMALIWGIATRYAVVERRRARFRFLLGTYLSEDVAAAMVDHGFQAMPSKKCVVTTMFTDIEGFTTLSQKLPPEDVAKVLSAYFQRTNPHIHKNSGAILRYVGDAIVAVWNAPRECADHAERACAAAHQIALLNAEPLRVDGEAFIVDGQPLKLRTRVGVHTGNVIACNVGSEDRFDFTVLGDDVNLSARLEGLNKYFRTTALTTRSSARLLRDASAVRCLGTIVVKGRTKGVRVFELLDAPLDAEWQRRFMRAVVLLAKGQDLKAKAEFLALKQSRPADGPTDFYLSRIESGKTSWPLEMDDK